MQTAPKQPESPSGGESEKAARLARAKSFEQFSVLYTFDSAGLDRWVEGNEGTLGDMVGRLIALEPESWDGDAVEDVGNRLHFLANIVAEHRSDHSEPVSSLLYELSTRCKVIGELLRNARKNRIMMAAGELEIPGGPAGAQ